MAVNCLLSISSTHQQLHLSLGCLQPQASVLEQESPKHPLCCSGPQTGAVPQSTVPQHTAVPCPLSPNTWLSPVPQHTTVPRPLARDCPMYPATQLSPVPPAYDCSPSPRTQLSPVPWRVTVLCTPTHNCSLSPGTELSPVPQHTSVSHPLAQSCPHCHPPHQPPATGQTGISEPLWELPALLSGCFLNRVTMSIIGGTGMRRQQTLSVPGLARRHNHRLSPSRWLLSHPAPGRHRRAFPANTPPRTQARSEAWSSTSRFPGGRGCSCLAGPRRLFFEQLRDEQIPTPRCCLLIAAL